MRTTSRPNLLAVLLAALSLSSCVRDEIHTITNAYHIDYVIDYDSVLYNKPKPAELLWLRFYDPTTGESIRGSERYVYPSGTDLSITPGYYTLVAYTHQNNATKITYPNNHSILTMETDLNSESPYRIINAPSHVFVAQLVNTYIPYVDARDSIYRITMHLTSPLDSWKVIVRGIKNLDYARNVTMYLTNQYQDILFKDLCREGNALIVFSGGPDQDGRNVEAEFNTFGMIPDKRYELQINITDASSTSYRKTVDVTDQVNDPENTRHIIIIDYDLTLSNMTQGGLQPTADEWDTEVNYHTVR